MKKFILSTILILNFTYADYIARVPLETNNGGSLSTGSVIFSNQATPPPPTPTDPNDWLGCRYGAIGDSFEYYIRVIERNSGYAPPPPMGAYGENNSWIYPATSANLWNEYLIRRTILETDGSASGLFSTGNMDIIRDAILNGTDLIGYGYTSDSKLIYSYRGNLILDTGTEKYYELCRTTNP